jgi:hypothetical protein
MEILSAPADRWPLSWPDVPRFWDGVVTEILSALADRGGQT